MSFVSVTFGTGAATTCRDNVVIPHESRILTSGRNPDTSSGFHTLRYPSFEVPSVIAQGIRVEMYSSSRWFSISSANVQQVSPASGSDKSDTAKVSAS